MEDQEQLDPWAKQLPLVLISLGFPLLHLSSTIELWLGIRWILKQLR